MSYIICFHLIRAIPIPAEEVPCVNSYPAETWLNQADVRTALHIPASVQNWEICR